MKKGSLLTLRFISILLLVVFSIILFTILIPIAYIWSINEKVVGKVLTPPKMIDIVKNQIYFTGCLLEIKTDQ